MKWKAKPKPELEHGTQRRIKKTFLLWPKTIQYETRWLCFAKWREELHVDYTDAYWEALYWMD